MHGGVRGRKFLGQRNFLLLDFVGQGPVSVVSFSNEKRTGNNKTTCYAGGEKSFSLSAKNLLRYNNDGLPATLKYLGGVLWTVIVYHIRSGTVSTT